jgi:lysophospholipase L1-like esterase
MKRPLIALSLLMILSNSALAQSAPPTTRRSFDPAVASIKAGKDGAPDKRFMELHQKFVDRAKQGDVDLLFLGDSITEGWTYNKPDFEKYFGKYKTANVGISGDRTQHVLWRIENGELNFPHPPKVVVLLIGVNNLTNDPPEKVATGVTNIVHILRNETNAKVLLLGVFPWGQKADDPKRAKVKALNEIISKLDDGKEIRFLDIGEKFLEADGSMSPEVMKDFLHPTKKGQEIWAEAMLPTLDEMMK